MGVIDRLLQGSIDMHIHCGPDPRVERRVDALEGAFQAQEAGMRAIVLKSHDYPTAPVAYIVSQAVKNMGIFGSIALDLEVGGLNVHVLEISAKMGAKVVWMPTFSSAYYRRRKNLEGGITILNENGKLLPVVAEILDIIKNYQMVLATGHLSTVEIFTLVDEATKRGVPKIVITHPTVQLSLEEQGKLAEKGSFIEHCFSHTMPLMDRLKPMKIIEAIRAVGADHCILTTDLGQAYNPTPVEGMRMMIATMLQCGLTEGEMELLIKINPAKLLGLD